TSDLRAFARQHFDAVDRGTDRNVTDRQAVTGLDRRFRTAHQLVAGNHTLRRDDVATFAIRVQNQRDVGRTIRIVFDTLHFRRDTIFIAFEIDDAIVLTMTTTDVTRGDVAVVVTAGRLGLRFHQASKRAAFVQVVVDDLDHAATTRRGRL